MHDKHRCFKTSNNFNKYWTTKKIGSVYSSVTWTEPLLTRIFRPSDRLSTARIPPLLFSLHLTSSHPTFLLPSLPPTRTRPACCTAAPLHPHPTSAEVRRTQARSRRPASGHHQQPLPPLPPPRVQITQVSYIAFTKMYLAVTWKNFASSTVTVLVSFLHALSCTYPFKLEDIGRYRHPAVRIHLSCTSLEKPRAHIMSKHSGFVYLLNFKKQTAQKKMQVEWFLKNWNPWLWHSWLSVFFLKNNKSFRPERSDNVQQNIATSSPLLHVFLFPYKLYWHVGIRERLQPSWNHFVNPPSFKRT
jgi:hypothetical protein